MNDEKLKNFWVFVPAMALLFGGGFARASDPDITSKLLIGPAGYDETLSGSGDFGKVQTASKPQVWSWSLDAEASETLSTDNFGNALLEHNDSLTGGIDMDVEDSFGAGLTYYFTVVPEEDLQNNGPEIHVSETVALKGDNSKSDNGDEEIGGKRADFEPTLKIKEGAKYIRYLQSFNGNIESKKGVTYPVQGYNALRQIAAELFFTLDAAEWLTVEYDYAYYFYDRSVAEFLQFLNSPLAAGLGAGTFGSSVSGFPMASHQITITIDPAEDWSIELAGEDSVQIVDLSNAWTYDGTVFRDFDDWRFGVGYEYETSETLTTYYYIANVRYTF